jgi:hypothetical protein
MASHQTWPACEDFTYMKVWETIKQMEETRTVKLPLKKINREDFFKKIISGKIPFWATSAEK